MATTTKNEIGVNKERIINLIEKNNRHPIRIVLSEKIDEKILSDILIKLGLTCHGEENSTYDEKRFYFTDEFDNEFDKIQNISCEFMFGSGMFDNIKHHIAKKMGPFLVKGGSFFNDLDYYLRRGFIIIDDKNSSIYIVSDELDFHIEEKKYCYIFGHYYLKYFYSNMSKVLVNEKAIDREELYTKAGDFRQKHKMKEPDINNIIKEISVYFGQDYKYLEWIDDSMQLILVKHFIKLIMDKYKEELASNKSENKSENNKEKVLDIEKLQSDILDKIKECGEKVKSVKDLIKDFDYSSKSDYEKSCLKIEEDLAECSENLNDANILNKINKIIDEINQVYKNVYNKKNNVSSLASYMGDEENIDLIERL